MHRRQFIQASGSCCAYIFGLAAFAPSLTRKVFAAQDDKNIVAKEKWGRLEKIEDGVWALISTPFDTRDFTTVCNGGIVAGEKGVLAIEAFMQDAGAKWLADQAEKLTGKRPTDVVCTHYHADHTAGHAGYATKDKRPNIWLTKTTQKAAEKSLAESGIESAKFEQVKLLSEKNPTEIDLGNRKINIVPRSGHTASDVSIEVVDPKIIWSGDLFFNRMFPNYKDAIPKRLNDYVGELLKLDGATIVPGHGPIADQTAVKSYQTFLSFVQSTAEEAFKAGKPAEEAAKDFKLPENLSEWVVWSPDVAENGYLSWYRQFEADKKSASKTNQQ